APLGGRRAAGTGRTRGDQVEAVRAPLLKSEPAPTAARAVQEQERRSAATAEHVDRRAADRALVVGRRHQPMKSPPLGDSHCPVKNDDSSEARNSAVAAISRGPPTRPIGGRASTALLPSSEIEAVSGVSM